MWIIIILLSLSFVSIAHAKTQCLVMFDGISCTHCAIADPVVYKQYVPSHDTLVIEYEIYENKNNAPLLYDMHNKYDSPLGIPLIFAYNNKIQTYVGDNSIVNFIDNNPNISSECILPDQQTNISNLRNIQIQGYPRLWYKNRILIINNPSTFSQGVKVLLSKNIIDSANSINTTVESLQPKEVNIAGGSVQFNNAIKIGENILEWNNNSTKYNSINEKNYTNYENKKISTKEKQNITWLGVISLAAVDAINPCALAVLVMMLLAILAYNPRKKEKVLLAGIYFSLAVFIMYFAYGILIIKFFKIIQAIGTMRLIIYKIVALLAIILAALEIKDYIHYTPGTVGTEMPMSLRPKVKKIINGITSPEGAFIVGLFVTLFLLPCTIGPYVIFGGIVSTMQYIRILPYISVYDLIFISPMIGITLLVYFGLTRVKDVKKWRDKNIRAIHLVAGIIICLLGIGMLIGIF